MDNVIEVWEHGELKNFCGPECYDAPLSRCNCMCGGANHNAGQEQAELNAAISGEEWLHIEILNARLDPAHVTCQILGVEAMIPLLV